MKRLIIALAVLLPAVSAGAQGLTFSYNASADVVSTYIWRGIYEGGLSFQPDLAIGWESDHTSFSFGTWWNLGATDWGFRKGLEQEEGYNPNTYLNKELDIYASLNLWGVTMGFVHYYYFDNASFFNFGDINDITGTAQTEVNLGYDFSTLLPKVDLQLSVNTMVSGSDVLETEDFSRRAFSTYIEACYTHHFNHDIDLCGAIGVTPWKGMYNQDLEEGSRDFAVNNLTLRLDKTWSLGVCDLDLYLQGTMNPHGLNKDNAFVRASGDDKIAVQQLMGAIGVNISF